MKRLARYGCLMESTEGMGGGLAVRLREALAERGLNQRQLAELLGHKTPSAISTWATGARAPSPENLRRIAEALNVEPSWLAGEGVDDEGAPRAGDPLSRIQALLSEAVRIADREGWELIARGTFGPVEMRYGTRTSGGARGAMADD